jgi:ABC-type sugar transport system ATPase subunit
VYVTHDQVEAMTMADRIVVLRHGVVQQIGTTAEVYGRPANRFVATFVGSPPMNLFAGRLVTDSAGRRFEGAVTVPLAEPGRIGVPDGEVTLGVRPEKIELVAAGTEGAIPAAVELLESVGADQYVSVSIHEAAAIIRVGADVVLSEGERIHLRFAPGGIHLFDAAGDRIPLEGEMRRFETASTEAVTTG